MLENFSIFNLGNLETNSVLIQKNGHAVIFDPAGSAEFWISVLNKKQLVLDAIYLTHGHFDHIEALDDLITIYNCPWFVHQNDLPVIYSANEFLNYNNLPNIKIPGSKSKSLISGEIKILDMDVMIFHTPGHTPGSCCFFFKKLNVLLAGDTLFAESIGRTDLPFSNPNDMKKSIALLIGETFPDSLEIISGHGSNVNMKYIRENNMFFNGKICL